MIGVPVNVVVEDIPSEEVARRLLSEVDLQPGRIFGKQGLGFIKSRLRQFNEAAAHGPWLVIADLDQYPCVTALAREWMKGVLPASGLCFRVAVREIESWLLADIEGIHRFLNLRSTVDAIHTRLAKTDSLQDPKRTLLELAAKSRSSGIREALVHGIPPHGFRPGPDYNGMLTRFIQNDWNPAQAATRSPSLSRARQRIREW